MKLMRVLLVLTLVFAVSAIAYAETQSVKISGDITMRAFARHNYDLNNDDMLRDAQPGVTPVRPAANASEPSQSSNWANHLMSTAEIQIDADLTDNVSGVIRLINQRVWGDNNYYANPNGELGIVGYPFMDQVVARPVNSNWNVSTNEDDWEKYEGKTAFAVQLDLAYIELKEFLYSPLTLRIGRQDLWFGRGFIVGAQLLDPDQALYATEYTAIRSFDAIRATLDYDPWTIDGVFSKIRENFRRSDDDTNLWGVNVGYVFDDYNAEAEGYWWFKQQRFTGGYAAASNAAVIPTIPFVTTNGVNSNDIHTFGGRGSFDPIEDWTIAAEAAYQLGQYIGAVGQRERRGRSAWAVDAMVECRYWQDQFAWRPVGGVEYIFYSGEDDMGNTMAGDGGVGNAPVSAGTYRGWDPIYRGKFDTAIREFQNVFYRTNMPSSPSFTNQHQLLVRGSIEPTDSLTCSATYAHFWLAEAWADTTNTGVGLPGVAHGVVPAGRNINQNQNLNVGDEVDLQVAWDYTEDVSFGFLCGWFFPGDHFGSSQGNDCATNIVGTVKLSF